MRAAVYEKYGSPHVLQLKMVDKPIPKDDELSIKVHAVEVTKTDCEMRGFKFQVKWFLLPLRITLGLLKPRKQILGGYFAGEVESVGRHVSKFKSGDRIFGAARMRLGAYGEYVCLPEKYTLVAKPENISFEEAAAVPLGGLNALHFLRRANIKNGEKVLVNGAGGSIGTFVLQIAKTMGAEVTAVDSGIKEEMVRRIGADHFLDYTREDFTKSGRTYDVIFSTVAKSDFAECINLLNPQGRYLIGNPRISDMLKSFLTSTFTDKRAIFAFANEKEEELLALKELIEAGKIQPVVDRIYSMEQIAEAHHRVETEQRLGSVIMTMQHELMRSPQH